jgi:hypothetical protein
MPISRKRETPRARSRFATFTHPIRRTKRTAPINAPMSGRACLAYRSLSDSTNTVTSLVVSGYSRARRAAIVFRSACACTIVTSRFSRA